MKNIKKRFFALSVAALLSLTSCGGNGVGVSSADTSEEGSYTSAEQSGTVDAPANIAMNINGGGDCIIDKTIEGTVVIDTEAQVKLILRGASINGTTGPAVYVKNCGGLTVVLEGESAVSDSELYSAEHGELKGAFFSEDIVTFKGDGSLTVKGNRGHGIASDDGIVVESGNITVESAVKDGVHANDLVEIKGGNLTVKAAGGDAVESEAEVKIWGGFLDLTADGDGIKASLNEKGAPFVTVTGGSVKINAKEDGIQSDGDLEINGGSLDITTTGAVNNDHSEQMAPGGGMPGGTRPQRPNGGTRPQRPDGGMTPPDGFDANISMERPDGGMTPPDEFDPNISMEMIDGGMTPPDEFDPNASLPSVETENNGSTDISSKAIKAAGTLTVKNGTLKISTTEDALHSDGDLTVEGGTFDISADDDAFHAEGALTVKNGTIKITKCYEGLEGKTVLVEDGEIDIVCTDDGVNSTSGGSSNNRPGNANADNSITINGGIIYVNAGGDGVDSNGALTINGGVLCVECAARGGDNALDADGARLINGGTVVALGGTDMLENPAQSSKQPTAVIYAGVSAGTTVALTDSEGKVILCYTSSVSATTVTISSSELKTGETYSFYTGVTPTGEKNCGGLYYGDGVSFTGGTKALDFTQSAMVVTAR